jgi:hypothetical protein
MFDLNALAHTATSSVNAHPSPFFAKFSPFRPYLTQANQNTFDTSSSSDTFAPRLEKTNGARLALGNH